MIFKPKRANQRVTVGVCERTRRRKNTLFFASSSSEVCCVFAKRRRTVVRLFYVLVSLVFVGGGCVDMKVRKLSLAFFAFYAFSKKKMSAC